MKIESTKSQVLVGKDLSGALIQLHITEYQALTTRATYWMILQAGLMPVVPVYLVLALDVWKSGEIMKEVVIWGAVAGLFLIGFVWSWTLVEIYTVVSYIERFLRPMVEKVVDTEMFWGYEPYLTKGRPTPLIWVDLPIPLLATVAFALAAVARYADHSRWDIVGASFNIGLLVVLWRYNLTAYRIRKQWSASDKTLAKKFEGYLSRRRTRNNKRA
jgi:hypothetical protein